MTNIESLNLKHYIDCKCEYTSDEMAFIIAVAAIVGDYGQMPLGELIVKYRKLLPIYGRTKEWLESDSKGGD